MQLTKIKRQEIALHLEKGYSLRSIAKMLDCSPSTISREIKRNSVKDEYNSEKAHHKKYIRRKYCRYQHQKIRANPKLENYIIQKLKDNWSPEKIAGRWNLEQPQDKIAFQRIYEWLQDKKPSLCCYLLRAKDKRKRRRNKRVQRQLIPNRVWIEERPKEADLRLKKGHFEGDLIVSSKGDKTIILTMIDRKSRYLIAYRLPNKKPQPIAGIMKNIAENLKIKTLTLDNGIEFQKYEEIDCNTYFCHPYSSWQKGSIENANGLIRRYIPKKSYLKDYSNKFIQDIVWQINNTPKKCLGFRTPREVFFASQE